MSFYYLLLILLNIGLGYGAGKYYLKRRDARMAERELISLSDAETESETASEPLVSEPEPKPELDPPVAEDPVAEEPDAEEPDAEAPAKPTAQEEPAETISDEPTSPPDAPEDPADSDDAGLIANSDVTRLIGSFREELGNYRETLDAFQQRAVGHQTELDSQAIHDSVKSLQDANETHAKRQTELLGQLHDVADGSANLGPITGRIEQAVHQEKWTIEAVNLELELSAAETDAEKGSGQLLEQTAALLAANSDSGDRLDAILNELEQEDTDPIAAEGLANSPADAELEQLSPELAGQEAVN